MNFRKTFIAFLSAAMLVALCACSGADGASSGSKPQVPEKPKGAQTVQELFDRSIDYFRSGCDYSKIADVHDQKAAVALYIVDMFDAYKDEDVTLDECMDKAELVFGDADTLKAQDPELAEMIMEEMDAEDATEYVTEYLDDLRNAFQTGEITEDHPDYEKYNQILTDADKGVDYIIEHYPELTESDMERWQFIGLDGAMEGLRSLAKLELDKEYLIEHFKDAEFDEFRPENVHTDECGVSSVELAVVIDGGAYGLDMVYYYDGQAYYLLDFGTWVGGIGG